jgi:hypothetical protein
MLKKCAFCRRVTSKHLTEKGITFRPSIIPITFQRFNQYLAIRGEWVGPLLWPAVGLHVVLTFLLVVARRDARNSPIHQ